MPEVAAELEETPANRAIGTTLWFENEHVRVWEVPLKPGQRAPFHRHAQTYFWPCIDPGKGFQRYPDGTAEAIDFTLGETVFNEITADDPMLHDLENIDDHLRRFVAIELKDLYRAAAMDTYDYTYSGHPTAWRGRPREPGDS